MCKERNVQRKPESRPICSDLRRDMGKGDVVWVMVMSTNSSDKECDHFYVCAWVIRIKAKGTFGRGQM